LNQTADLQIVTAEIESEIFGVMGLAPDSWMRRVLGPIFRFPTRRIAGYIVDLDHDVAAHGWCAGASAFLSRFVDNVRVSGLENVPKEGPLLVVSNHPAAYDVIILASILGREDLKIISSNAPFITLLPSIIPHFIFISDNPHGRMATVRTALRHLLDGGALLIFPRGEAEPDPAVYPGAEESLEKWSMSLELFLRKAPQTMTVVTIVSGMLSKRWYHNPLVRIWKRPEQRHKMAEIFQVIQQLLWAKDLSLDPIVDFSKSLSVEQLCLADPSPGCLLEGIMSQAREMLDERDKITGLAGS
jgi:Acyltransferase